MEEHFEFSKHAGPTSTQYVIRKSCRVAPVNCYHIVVVHRGSNSKNMRMVMMRNNRIADLLDKYHQSHPHFILKAST